MQILLAGSRAQATTTLQRFAGAQGWVIDELGDGMFRLRVPGAPLSAATICQLDEYGQDTVLNVWLPDAPEEAAEKMAAALEELTEGVVSERGADLIRRLRRIEGQIRGLQRMVGQNRECEAIMTQFAAVMAALKRAAAQLVAEHLVACVQDEVAAGGDPAAMLNQRLLRILF